MASCMRWSCKLQPSLPQLSLATSPESCERLLSKKCQAKDCMVSNARLKSTMIRSSNGKQIGPEKNHNKQLLPHGKAQGQMINLKRFASLVCLYPELNECRVLLVEKCIKSSSDHGESSEIVLPVGQVFGYWNNEVITSEAAELIGLDPDFVKFIHTLEPLMTKNNDLIVPVVAVLRHKRAFKPESNREAIFDVPLSMFLKINHLTTKSSEEQGIMKMTYKFDFEREKRKVVIESITASILISAALYVYQQ